MFRLDSETRMNLLWALRLRKVVKTEISRLSKFEMFIFLLWSPRNIYLTIGRKLENFSRKIKLFIDDILPIKTSLKDFKYKFNWIIISRNEIQMKFNFEGFRGIECPISSFSRCKWTLQRKNAISQHFSFSVQGSSFEI